MWRYCFFCVCRIGILNEKFVDVSQKKSIRDSSIKLWVLLILYKITVMIWIDYKVYSTFVWEFQLLCPIFSVLLLAYVLETVV